jgi:hypothetical protein
MGENPLERVTVEASKYFKKKQYDIIKHACNRFKLVLKVMIYLISSGVIL